MERSGIHISRADLRQCRFPLSGHGDIGNLLVVYSQINGQPFVGRYKRFFLPHDVFPRKECLDNGGTGGRCPDPRVFHGLAFFLILYFPARALHRREQRGFGMQGLGLGLSLLHFDITDGRLIAFRQIGQYG